MPMKKRRTVKPADELTNPVKAVGQALQNRIIPIGILGPNLSHNGPSKKRITIVPMEAAIEDVQISESLMFKLFCTSFNNGVMENLLHKMGRNFVNEYS